MKLDCAGNNRIFVELEGIDQNNSLGVPLAGHNFVGNLPLERKQMVLGEDHREGILGG
jgi:hypothetical protein